VGVSLIGANRLVMGIGMEEWFFDPRLQRQSLIPIPNFISSAVVIPMLDKCCRKGVHTNTNLMCLCHVARCEHQDPRLALIETFCKQINLLLTDQKNNNPSKLMALVINIEKYSYSFPVGSSLVCVRNCQKPCFVS